MPITAAAVALAAVSACALVVTDVRGRAETRRTASLLASTDLRMANVRSELTSTDARARSTTAQAGALEASNATARAAVATANAAISSTEAGLFFAGYNLSALTTCLGGVTQALDQVAVGQTAGALSSLGAVSTNCAAAKPTGP
jgi:hypothetical protein